MNLKKEINLNKKFIIMMIFLNVIALGLYYSYALFETKVIKDNVVVIKTATITTSIPGTTNNQIVIQANSTKSVTINLTSNYSGTLKYQVYYKIINGENTIKLSSTDVTTFGEINGSKTINCVIENTGSSDTTIEIWTKEGLVGSVIELDNNTYPFEVLVTYDKGNLLYGLEDTDWVTKERMKYKIDDGVVTVNAFLNDGNGLTSGKVYLQAGKKYIFNCNTSGSWEAHSNANIEQVEAFLVKDGILVNGWVHMNSNNNFVFTPSETGTYWLRLDVNQEGQTHTFSNISIVEKDESKETKIVKYNDTYGELLTMPVRDGYTFMGWNGKNLLNYSIINSMMEQSGISVDSNDYVSDISTSTDTRGWLYSYNSGWQQNISTGTYSLSLTFINKATRSYDTRIVISDENDYVLVNENIGDLDLFTTNFVLNDFGSINIVAKSYNGVYRIQLEEGDTSTEWEPYYLTNTTKVTQTKDHTLKAIWKEST